MLGNDDPAPIERVNSPVISMARPWTEHPMPSNSRANIRTESSRHRSQRAARSPQEFAEAIVEVDGYWSALAPHSPRGLT